MPALMPMTANSGASMMTTDLDVIHEIRKNLDSRQYDVLDSE